jgi:hypothetical protein
MSSFLANFAPEQNYDIVISSKGTPTGVDEAGRPTYGAATVKYNAKGWFWLLGASEVLANDKINNPSTHQVAIDPLYLTGDVSPEDDITIDGEAFKLYRADNVHKLSDVIIFQVARKT